MKIFVSLVLVMIIIASIYKYVKEKKLLLLILAIALIIFLGYSYFTYDGAVRLSIVTDSYKPVEAYSNKLVESFYDETDGKRYFHSEEEIHIKTGTLWNYECNNYSIIKFCKYYGF